MGVQAPDLTRCGSKRSSIPGANLAETPGSVRALPVLIPDRFWKKVNGDGPTPSHRPELGPCWVWLGCLTAGYGKVSAGARQVQAHRWTLAVASDRLDAPPTLQACHHCDNRACVNCLPGIGAFCTALADALNEENSEGKGMTPIRGWRDPPVTDPAKPHVALHQRPRFCGIEYRVKARSQATLVNWCPWCRADLRVWLSADERAVADAVKKTDGAA